MMKKKFPIYRQLDAMDCGPTCLRMIAKYYGKGYSTSTLRDGSFVTRRGASLSGLSEAAEKIGFKTLAIEARFEQLDEEIPLPCVIHWHSNHFVVVPPQKFSARRSRRRVVLADPAHGEIKVDRDTFMKGWIKPGSNRGVILVMNPTQSFYDEQGEANQSGFRFMLGYLKPYRRYLFQLILGMVIGSLLSLIFPFLMQGLVDYGINQQNKRFIYLVLISQLLLFAGNTAIELIRSWILLHMNTRINISILSEFLVKLMKLPIRFFDTRLLGDIMQRINDHERIEQFLTSTSLSTVFSFINLVVFSCVLAIYNVSIFLLFLAGSAVSVCWILFFLKRRREIDYKRFQQLAINQNSIYELITGMQDIKLNNSEVTKRWEWEKVQVKLFKLSVKGLSIEQYQLVGGQFFNQLKNILVSYVAALEVMNGHITLGMMLSISYIIGQMNSPIEQFLQFFRSAQDAKISMDRIREIHGHENEETAGITGMVYASRGTRINADGTLHKNSGAEIRLDNVAFQYEGPASPMVLQNIDISIPVGKVLAIVGASGSGKTTLLKLLLKFYAPVQGRIRIGETDLEGVSARYWRGQCGVVMQDSFIFNDTIARNIAVGDEVIDEQKLSYAVQVANIGDFIRSLPAGFATKIGNTGSGISSGQKQRILIARAVYRDPQYIFFDEATSALDATNERVIMQNLNQFFSGRTVVVIAHRLSTVKNADHIAVLEHGRIVEAGDHETLSIKRGVYFELVKNQLELGQ